MIGVAEIEDDKIFRSVRRSAGAQINCLEEIEVVADQQYHQAYGEESDEKLRTVRYDDQKDVPKEDPMMCRIMQEPERPVPLVLVDSRRDGVWKRVTERLQEMENVELPRDNVRCPLAKAVHTARERQKPGPNMREPA